MEIDEWKNLKNGDKIIHKDFVFMSPTILRKGKVSTNPRWGTYGSSNGEFTIQGEVSTGCRGCSDNTELKSMKISLAQALLFWELEK